MREIWRPVWGYVGYYEVSNFGRVKSLSRKVWRGKKGFRLHRGRVLKPKKRNKYWAVNLSKDGEIFTKSIHRLVLEAFVGSCPFNMMTRHLDGNRGNNNLSNLKYGTNSENQLDRFRHDARIER